MQKLKLKGAEIRYQNFREFSKAEKKWLFAAKLCQTPQIAKFSFWLIDPS